MNVTLVLLPIVNYSTSKPFINTFSPCMILSSSMEAKRRTNPNWLQLPIDITANILFRLDTFEILNIARNVCPLWWNVCKNPLMWQTIRMENFDLVNLTDDNQVCDYLDKICRYAVDLSCGNLKDIYIFGFASDDLLKYIADRATQLRCIRLDHCNQISKEGLIELGTKLPLLEELDITMDLFPGLCLPHKLQLFRVLPFESAADYNDEAFAIAKTMPRLRHLNLSGNVLNDDGLLAILDGCPLLESLDLEGCFNISESLEDRCYDQIKDLRLSDFWSKMCFCEKNGMSSDDTEDSSYHSSDSDDIEDSSYHSSDSDYHSSDSS